MYDTNYINKNKNAMTFRVSLTLQAVHVWLGCVVRGASDTSSGKAKDEEIMSLVQLPQERLVEIREIPSLIKTDYEAGQIKEATTRFGAGRIRMAQMLNLLTNLRLVS